MGKEAPPHAREKASPRMEEASPRTREEAPPRVDEVTLCVEEASPRFGEQATPRTEEEEEEASSDVGEVIETPLMREEPKRDIKKDKAYTRSFQATEQNARQQLISQHRADNQKPGKYKSKRMHNGVC